MTDREVVNRQYCGTFWVIIGDCRPLVNNGSREMEEEQTKGLVVVGWTTEKQETRPRVAKERATQACQGCRRFVSETTTGSIFRFYAAGSGGCWVVIVVVIVALSRLSCLYFVHMFH